MAIILGRKPGGGGSSGGGAPSGPASGDLTGTYPGPTISTSVISAFGRTLVDDADAATARATLGITQTGVGCGAKVKNSAPQTISDSSWTSLTADTEFFDTDAFHSTVTNTSRITVPAGKGGYYVVTLGLSFASNLVGERLVRFFVNGTTQGARTADSPNTTNDILGVVASDMLLLVATDYIEVQVFQSSTGNLDVTLEQFGALRVGT